MASITHVVQQGECLTSIAKAHKFVVKDKYGPLREGEVERARQWGMELASAARH